MGQRQSKGAVKHYIIAASQCHDVSIKALMGAFKWGFVDKDGLVAALRAHQDALDATKSRRGKQPSNMKYEIMVYCNK